MIIKDYEVSVQDNMIVLKKDGQIKGYKVNDTYGYYFKFNKKSISADGGAEGLYQKLERETMDGILHWFINALEQVKPVFETTA